MSDRLPIVAEADVVVVGGSSGAVACALAAAAAGARVHLLAPRAYLGDDICAPFDYWPRADDEVAGTLAPQVFAHGADPAATPPLTPPTPMHVKRTLEQALVAAGVPFLLNVHPAGVLRDAAGAIGGVVMASRAGRHGVVAGQVVDATRSGQVARQAGLAFTAWAGGEIAVAHVTIGGPERDLPGVVREELPAFVAPTKDGPVSVPARRHRLRADAGDGSWSALARLRATVVERLWTPGIWQQGEVLDLLPPTRLAGPERVVAWPGCSGFPLAALAAAPGLHLLGAALPASAAVRARLSRPLHLMAVGERLGAALGAARRQPTGALGAACAGAVPLSAGELRGAQEALRPGQRATGFVAVDPAQAGVPRLGRFDVVVVGGGTGGAPAAIGAARAGARTLVIEALPALGGVGTLGQIAGYWFGNRVGFTAEIDAGVSGLEPKAMPQPGLWSPPAKAAWYHGQCAAAGVECRFGAIVCGVWVVDRRVRGVLIAGPEGFGLIEAGAVVDATGNADVAAAAGAATTGIGADEVAVQGTGLAGVGPDRRYHNSDHSFSDDCDIVDATQFLVAAKVKFAASFDAGQLIDSRERRQIVGEASLEPVDFLCDRRYRDTICIASSNFDTHGYTVHPVFLVKPPDKERLWVPVSYRCLLPRGLEGVLVIGLGLSAHRDAIPVVRMQPDVQNHGYAAGRAAALAALAGSDVRAIDLRALQRHLVAIGSLPERVLVDDDAFVVSDERLLAAIERGLDDWAGLALVFAHGARCRPWLRAAHDAARDGAAAARRRRLALVLGLLGDGHGAGTLAAAITAAPWDAGWNYTGMGQFGMSASPLDALIIALGQCGDATAWPALLAKAAALAAVAEPDFSHCRALALAFEHLHVRHPDRAAAAALAALLRRPGLSGHDHGDQAAVQAALTADTNENGVRNRALRELHLARACFRCGDDAGLAAGILRRYAGDLRGHFARHARAVLAAAPLSAAASG